MIEKDKIYKWNKGYIKVINFDEKNNLVELTAVTVDGLITTYFTYFKIFKNAAELTDFEKIYWVNECIKTGEYISFKKFNMTLKEIVNKINKL